MQVDARVGKILYRVRSENLLQVVAHVGRGFVIGARATPGNLQARRHFRHGLLSRDAHTGKGRCQLRKEFRHVLQFNQTGLAARGQNIEGLVQPFGRDAQIVPQGKRGRAQIVHAGPGRRGCPCQYSPVLFQFLPALNAAGRKNLHPLKDVRLVLIGVPRNVSHGKGELRFIRRAHVAGNGYVADGVLLFGGGLDGHARRGHERRALHGELAKPGIDAPTLFGHGVAVFHRAGKGFFVAPEFHLPATQGAHGRFRP